MRGPNDGTGGCSLIQEASAGGAPWKKLPARLHQLTVEVKEANTKKTCKAAIGAGFIAQLTAVVCMFSRCKEYVLTSLVL